MLALLGWAAAVDLRTRRIPNWIPFALILGGIGRSFMPGSTLSPGEAAGGLGAGFGLMLLLFAINAVGGADVKLLAAVGAWVGPVVVLKVFAVEAILGMVIVVAQAMRRGRVAALARNSAVLAMNLARGEFGSEEDLAPTDERALPFAVPLLLATAGVVVWG
jgi:prepilin peptidase CpaA